MTVWAIYNHGTGGSSLKGSDKGEIVNLFGNNDRNQQFRGKIITEGAGSIGDPTQTVLAFARSQQGTYSVTRQQGKPLAATVERGIGSAAGTGVAENVQNTLEIIRALNLAGLRPEAINMLGWSRGAVTCIRIAYFLSQSQDQNLRDIPINIFAVDPVAGFGHNTEVDAMTINANVRNYVATMATGEKRRFFKPIAGHRLTITSPEVTRAWILPVPGHHSDTAKNNNNVGKIVFNLAYRFLTACETDVSAMRLYRLENLAAWQLYEQVMVGAAEVHTTSVKGQLTMGGKAYQRDREAAEHSYGEIFFPNVHARRLFESVYPVCYQAYFSAAEGPRRNTVSWATRYSPRIVAEQKLNGMSKAMIDKLQALGPAGADSQIALPPNVANLITGLRLTD